MPIHAMVVVPTTASIRFFPDAMMTRNIQSPHWQLASSAWLNASKQAFQF